MNPFTITGGAGIRSPLQRWHKSQNAVFDSANGAQFVSRYQAVELEANRAKNLGLADLTTFPRCGIKAGHDGQYLRTQGYNLPGGANLAALQSSGSLLLRLSDTEFWLLSDLQQQAKVFAADLVDLPATCYDLPRLHSHCWLALSGDMAPDVLAKLCAVDLRCSAFAVNHIAQTSLARVNVIIVRTDTASGAPRFYLLSDISSCEYLWHCLLDAMQEFSGTTIGLNALQQL